ncbi:MAG: hypothetical protein MRJ68_17930 [Nitrospira sp.]|nr:hypothetical protein [Nitrospira sp.]
MPSVLLITLFLIGSSFSSCVGTSPYTSQPPPTVHVERYIETAGLSQLPNRRLAITSFGIEFDTKLLLPLPAGQRRHIHTVSHGHKALVLGLPEDQMQALADHAYTQLVDNLTAAGYDIVPYETYNTLPPYRSLIHLGGHASPTSMTFTRGCPDHVIHGEALVFAPTGLEWYAPPVGDVESHLGTTLASLGTELPLMGRGLLGDEAIGHVEADLANILDATLVKAYYVVRPVESLMEAEGRNGTFPIEGKTVIGGGETRLAFRTPGAPTSHHLLGRNAPPRDGNAFVRLLRDVRIRNGPTSSQDLETYLDVIGKLFVLALLVER